MIPRWLVRAWHRDPVLTFLALSLIFIGLAGLAYGLVFGK